VRVPALDQEYTTNLSLWKHRIIRQSVLEEQAQVDPVALGLAKRKIQAIVDEGRQRKRQQTRTRIARWDMAGKSTRDASLIEPPQADVTPPSVMESQATEVIALPDQVSHPLDTCDETDWEVSYAPLKILPAPQTTEVPHG
jgi:hypothetical protein